MGITIVLLPSEDNNLAEWPRDKIKGYVWRILAPKSVSIVDILQSCITNFLASATNGYKWTVIGGKYVSIMR